VPILPRRSNSAAKPPPTRVAVPVSHNAGARRAGRPQDTTVHMLLRTPADIAPGPEGRVVDGRRLEVDPPAQAAVADAGRNLLGALGRGRVVDGAVAARRVAVTARLDPVRIDTRCALGGWPVGAAVVDIEDVEGVDMARDVPVFWRVG
jgi:hypothetical protein